MVSTRERLSAKAARLFAERGYHGTSMNDLAQALGIRKSSLYAHIETKEHLLAELALAGAEIFHAALDALPVDADPGERLRLALVAHLRVVRTQLDVATVWLQEWRFLTGASRQEFLRQRHAYERRVRELFEDAVSAGVLRADLDRDAATLLFLSAANWAYTWFTSDTDPASVADRYWDILLQGMAPPAAVSRGR